MIADLVDGAAALVECEDPLEAELDGALFVAMATLGGDEAVASFTDVFIPAIEARGNAPALMLLAALGATASGGPEGMAEAAEAARSAAGRLAASGVPVPDWARELEQPVTAGPFSRLYDVDETMSALFGSFQRAGRDHAILVVVDHANRSAADDIFLMDAARLPETIAEIREAGPRDGLTIKTEELAAPEFRWYVEQAMLARAAHDAEADDPGPTGLFDDEDERPEYPVLAVLTRARLAALPEPQEPEGAGQPGRDADD